MSEIISVFAKALFETKTIAIIYRGIRKIDKWENGNELIVEM